MNPETLDQFTTKRRPNRDNQEAAPSTGWRELYHILDVEPPDEPCNRPPDTLEAIARTDRPRRYRRKHARGVTT
jgi:hypothetical protein